MTRREIEALAFAVRRLPGRPLDRAEVAHAIGQVVVEGRADQDHAFSKWLKACGLPDSRAMG